MEKPTKRKLILIAIILFLTFLLPLGVRWAIKNFQFTFAELIFHLKVPMTGANLKPFLSFGKRCILPATIYTIIILIILYNPFDLKLTLGIKNKNKKLYPFKIPYYPIFLAIIFSISFFYSFNKIGFFKYLKDQYTHSVFIEENYIDPRNVELIFPESKRNLIYIYVESLETTYVNFENGGAQISNLMPFLTELAFDEINFSHTEKLGGSQQLTGTTWTAGGMVAQTSGLPLNLPMLDVNSYGKYTSFLPGAYTLGDILNEAGYNQMIMMGSDGYFGGRTNYFNQHGNYEIYDYNSALEEGRFESDYHVWWGFEDNKLFEYAKEKILELALLDKPFNFTMLTADMHFPDGYLSEDCPIIYSEHMSNVVNCTDIHLREFIKWLKKQSFYYNTTIIISGDHLSMDANYFSNLNQEYERTIFNVILNSVIKTDYSKLRNFGTIDLFPTTLASIGVEIIGNRLGLGTNLFSGEKTLIEEYGIWFVNSELAKNSKFYNKNLLYPSK